MAPDWKQTNIAVILILLLAACEYRPYGALEDACKAAGGELVRSHTPNKPTCVKPINLEAS